MKVKKMPVVWISLILFAATLVRFQNFSNRVLFGPEQAISLITSANYIKNGISFLGQPYFHTTSTGLTMFYPPQFNFFLMPFLILFNYDPLPITALFAFLNLFTGLVIYYYANKLAGLRVAITTLVLFLFNAVMINYSLFIWGLHFFALFGWLLFISIVFLPKVKHQALLVFVMGIVSGIGISLEYPFALYSVIDWVCYILRSRRKLAIAISFILGGIVGNLPMVIFDLRNDWYYTRVLIQYAIDQYQHRTHTLDLFHFLPLWGIGAFLIAYTINRFIKPFILILLILLVYVYLNINSSWVNLSKPVGMPLDLTYQDYVNTLGLISLNPDSRINVATLWDFDTRAHPLRYLVEHRQKLPVQGVDQYKDLDAFYVLAPNDLDINSHSVYELNSYQPFKVTSIKPITPLINFYKLSK